MEELHKNSLARAESIRQFRQHANLLLELVSEIDACAKHHSRTVRLEAAEAAYWYLMSEARKVRDDARDMLLMLKQRHMLAHGIVDGWDRWECECDYCDMKLDVVVADGVMPYHCPNCGHRFETPPLNASMQRRRRETAK